MRLLLDTHFFVWACLEPDRLTQTQKRIITEPANDVFVSVASAWEIAIKRALGRIEFPAERFEEIAAGMGFETQAITVAHAVAAGSLPRHHGDPFDRMLIAQAQHEGQTIITVDTLFSRYDVAIL